MSENAAMLQRLKELQQLQVQLLEEQEEARRILEQSQDEARRAKEEYDKAEAERRKKGETVDAYQANIRKMAAEFEEAAAREAAQMESLQAVNGEREREEELQKQHAQGQEQQEEGSTDYGGIAKASENDAEVRIAAEAPAAEPAKQDSAQDTKQVQQKITSAVNKQASAASHTHNVGYEKWDKLDVDALLAEQEHREQQDEARKQAQSKRAARDPTRNSTPSQRNTNATGIRRDCVCVLHVIEGSVVPGTEQTDAVSVPRGSNSPSYILERHNNIGQYVLYLQAAPGGRFLVGDSPTSADSPPIPQSQDAWQPTIAVRGDAADRGTGGEDVIVQFRDEFHPHGAEVRLRLQQRIDISRSSLTAAAAVSSATGSSMCSCLVLKLRWASHTSEHAMMLTDFGDSRPARVDGGVDAARRVWQRGDVHCRFCGQGLARPGAVRQVLPLPSANWGEMMDALLCHVHDDVPAAEDPDDPDDVAGGSEAASVASDAVGAGGSRSGGGGIGAMGALMTMSGSLNAKQGTCLVGPTYLLVRRDDLRKSALRIDRKVALASGFVVQCKRCLTPLGVVTEPSDPEDEADQRRRRLQRCDCVVPELNTARIFQQSKSDASSTGRGRKLLSLSADSKLRQKKKKAFLHDVKLNKFRIVMTDSLSESSQDLVEAYDAEAHVGAQILALAESKGCFRFALCGIADGRARIRIVLSNFTTELQSIGMPLRRVLRVEFDDQPETWKPAQEPVSPDSMLDSLQASTDHWLSKADGRRLFFHEDELDDVAVALRANHALLPSPYNSFQGRRVGFLRW